MESPIEFLLEKYEQLDIEFKTGKITVWDYVKKKEQVAFEARKKFRSAISIAWENGSLKSDQTTQGVDYGRGSEYHDKTYPTLPTKDSSVSK